MSEQNTKGKQQETWDHPYYTVLSQYVKDLSLENPHAPYSIIDRNEKTGSTNISFLTQTQEISHPKFEDLHEVSLKLNISTTTKDRIPILLELDYCVLCTVHNMESDKQLHYMLHCELPRILFPYVRQLVSDYTAQAGYNPLYIPPTNFNALYVSRFGKTWEEGVELPKDKEETKKSA